MPRRNNITVDEIGDLFIAKIRLTVLDYNTGKKYEYDPEYYSLMKYLLPEEEYKLIKDSVVSSVVTIDAGEVSVFAHVLRNNF